MCGILWGSAFPSVKTGYELFQIAPEDNASKLLFAGIRFGMAGLVTILFASLKRKRACLPDRRNIAGILVLGLVQTTLQYVFFYLGLAKHYRREGFYFWRGEHLFRGSAGPLYLPG